MRGGGRDDADGGNWRNEGGNGGAVSATEKYTAVNIACDQVIDPMWNSVNNGDIQGTAPLQGKSSGSYMEDFTLAAGNSVTDEAFIECAVDNYAKYFQSAYLSDRAGEKDTVVTRVLLNGNYNRDLTGSPVADTALYNRTYDADGNVMEEVAPEPVPYAEDTTCWWKTCALMEENGIDYYAYAVAGARRVGIEPWASIRMNDSHNYGKETWAGFTAEGNRSIQINGERGIRFNYADASVRTYWKNYIVDMVTRYDVSGVELDFLRDIQYGLSRAETDVITDWLKEEVRPAIDAVLAADELERPGYEREKIEISARVFTEEDQSLEIGLDAAQWVADGSIDVLIISGYDNISYDYSVSAWRNSVEEKGGADDYDLLVGGSHYISGYDSTNNKYHTRSFRMQESYAKGFASAAYYNGADGLYLFNTYRPQDTGYTSVTPEGISVQHGGSWEKLLIKYKSMVPEISETGLRSYVFTDEQAKKYDMELPHSIFAGDSATFSVNTANKPEAGYYTVLVGIDSNDGYLYNNLDVNVNGVTAEQIRDVPTDPAFVFSESGEAYTPGHISQVAPRVMQYSVPLSAVRDGVNDIEIINNGDGTQSIMWLQVNTDSTPGAEPEQAVYQLAEDTVLTVKRDETHKFPVLTWNEGDCNGVQIFRKAYGESGYTKIATVVGGSTSFVDESASASQGFEYYVQNISSLPGAEYPPSNVVGVGNADYKFLATETSANGLWEGRYGGLGYIINGYATNYIASTPSVGQGQEANVWTRETENVPQLVVAPDYLTEVRNSCGGARVILSGDARALARPAWQGDGEAIRLQLNNDGAPATKNEDFTPKDYTMTFIADDEDVRYEFTAYFAANSATKVTETLPIEIRDLEGNVLVGVNIVPAEYTATGLFITFEVKGSFQLSFPMIYSANAGMGERYGFASYFFDELGTAEDRTAVPLTRPSTFVYETTEAETYLFTVTENGYSYGIKDEKTIVRKELATGEITTYTESDAGTAFPTEIHTAWPISSDAYLSVGNGIVCVKLTSYDLTASGAYKSGRSMARLIDFNGAEPVAKYFGLFYAQEDDSWATGAGDLIKIQGNVLYAATNDMSFFFNVEGLLSGVKPDMGTADSVTYGPKTFDDRAKGWNVHNNSHFYVGMDEAYADENNGGERKMSLSGKVSDFVLCEEKGKTYLVLTMQSGNSHVAYKAEFSVPADNASSYTVGIPKPEIHGVRPFGDAIVSRADMMYYGDLGAVDARQAFMVGERLFIVNNGPGVTDAKDSVILVFDTSGKLYPSVYIGKIFIENAKIDHAVLYGGRIAVAASDGDIYFFSPGTLSSVDSLETGEPIYKLETVGEDLYAYADGKIFRVYSEYGEVTAEEVTLGNVRYIEREGTIHAYACISNRTSSEITLKYVIGDAETTITLAAGETVSISGTGEIISLVTIEGTTLASAAKTDSNTVIDKIYGA